MPSVRVTAFHTLQEIEQTGRGSKAALQPYLNSLADRRDRNLLQSLVLGVLRYRSQLDWALDGHLRKPQKLQSSLRQILRIALYQHWFLERIPPYALVNEAVNMSKVLVHKSASRLVNAVLRKLLNKSREEMLELLNLDTLSDRAIALAHPSWLLKRWESHFTKQQLQIIIDANNNPAEKFIHLVYNAQQEISSQSGDSLSPVPGELNVYRLRLDLCNRFFDQPMPQSFFYQDYHSAWLTSLIPMEGDILDVCAGRGGKTMALANRLEQQRNERESSKKTHIFATDVRYNKLGELNQRFSEAGFSTPLSVFSWNALVPMKNALHRFDTVVLDAPCSSTGIIRRHPEIKWRVNERAIAMSADKQFNLLKVVSRYIKPGGILLYSVCSIEPEEGSMLIERFMKACPGFSPAELPSPPKQSHSIVPSMGQLLLLPSKGGGDGFFIAILRRDSLATR